MLRDILPSTKTYETKLYDHTWQIEVRMISYKAKQEYFAALLKNKKVKEGEIEVTNINAVDLLETFKILFFSGLVSLKIDEQEEEINKDTYEYLINNLSQACEWIQTCILEHNGNFFLMKK